MQQVKIHSPPCGEQGKWEELYADLSVPETVRERELRSAHALQRPMFGNTYAEDILAPRQHVGTDLEAVLVTPQTPSHLIEQSIELVRELWPPRSGVPADLAPPATWQRMIERKRSGNSYFVDDEPPLRGRIGVMDCVFLYVSRTSCDASSLSSRRLAEGQELVAIHGLYHYVSRPHRYFCARLGVMPRCQGRGIGRRVVSHQIALALQLGAKTQWLFTEADRASNGRVIDMFARWGFVPSRLRCSYNGSAQVFMYLDLTPGSPGWNLAHHCAVTG